MAIFKCKMCGGDLEITEGMTVCECEFCGTNQTVPTADNEKKTNLFNRANRLRFANEFDSAAGVFQSIVSEFPEEAEAYWGLCLCKYGIEYVDDPATAKKIPTCHRTSFESIADDSNFELACEYADAAAKRLYREEAKEIDRIQQAILDIVKNEKPYDIFICYKETAADGQRTKDSVLAQDMYDALTGKGYKVFFSRITLEDKLGQEYEPYIFAALTSAKIMLAVGTDYEYYNAVWVKNEWSRYIDLMKQDKSKVLIPCYADIDPFDMPKEFKNLQGQDMGKIGFIQDLTRGIDKILRPAGEQPAAVQQVVSAAGPTLDSLLKRVFMYLSDGDWDNANSYCEKVLDIDPENAQAYLGKLLAELKVPSIEQLGKQNKAFDHMGNYKKVMTYGDEALKAKLSEYNDNATMTEQENIEELKKIDEKYRMALQFEKENTEEGYEKAVEIFETILEYSNSAELCEQCRDKLIKLDLSENYECDGSKLVEYLGNKETVIIPRGITQIEDFAFSDCESIQKVVIADSVTSIGSNAFCNCKSLKNIEIPDSVTSIGDSAFADCEFLSEVSIPNNVVSIEDGTFFNCKSLINVVIPDGVTSIGDLAFLSCKSLKSIVIPESVTSIGYNAFGGCESLEKIVIPDSVVSIGSELFDGCNKLKDMIVSDRIIEMMREADEENRKEEEKQRNEDEKKRQDDELKACQNDWRRQGVCLYCGGTFTGLFSKKCSACGKPKDY